MKKIFLPIFCILMIFNISGCSNVGNGGFTDENKSNTMYEDRKKNNKISTNNNSQQNNDRYKQTDYSEPLKDNNLPEGYLGKSVAKLEEIHTIDRHIDLDKLVAEVESDIPNKRIILFKNNDTNDLVYKSIYIKDDQHLKIVELTNDQMIYNGTIK